MGTWMETQISIYRERSVDTFEYLGYILAENGDLDAEKTHRIQSGWRNWNRVLESMCDRRIIVRVNGKVYKTVVTCKTINAEIWALKKAQEKTLDLAEIRMLSWMSAIGMI